MSQVSRPGLPPQLDDAVWLRRKLLSEGTMGIALELHVTRYQVRKACERHGLEPGPAGRRRGSTTPARQLRARRRPAIERVVQRITEDADELRPEGEAAPTERLIASRTIAYDAARRAGDRLAQIDAAVAAAAAWTRLVDQLQCLETR